MEIDLTSLNSRIITEVKIDDVVSFDEEYLKNSAIKRLDNVKVVGTIRVNSTNDNILDVNVMGSMLLEDSVSLEDINYPFSIQIEEKISGNDENTIDIMDVLWQNIILEIPLKFTNVKDYSKFQGEGWKLVSEDELKVENNPFNELDSIFGEEWEYGSSIS